MMVTPLHHLHRPKSLDDKKYLVVHKNAQFTMRNDQFYVCVGFLSCTVLSIFVAAPRTTYRAVCRPFCWHNGCRKMWLPSSPMHVQMTPMQIESRRDRSDHLSRQYCGRNVRDFWSLFHVFFVGRLCLSLRLWGQWHVLRYEWHRLPNTCVYIHAHTYRW